MIFLGMYEGQVCRIAADSPNRSVLITGISGTGKTCRMQQMEVDSALQTHKAIVFDTSSTHSKQQIFSPLQEKFESLSNRISVTEDGLYIPLLTPVNSESCKRESDFSIISAAVSAFAVPLHLGTAQTGILRDALIFALHNMDSYSNELPAIVDGLKHQGPMGKTVHQKLWDLLNCGVLKKSQKNILSGRINILDLNDLERPVQTILIELFLSLLFRIKRHTEDTFVYDLFLDECQNFNLKPNSGISQLLREGRKFGINMVLSTQSLGIFNKETLPMLSQAATKLYFKPAVKDITKVAKQLSYENWEKWQAKLKILNVGECIADGNLDISGTTVGHPLLLV